MNIENYKVTGKHKIKLADFKTNDTGNFEKSGDVTSIISKNMSEFSEYQDRFFAEAKEALLIVFQAMDAAGKDSAIKNVMSGVNPQGINVYSFKQPSAEERSHDYLWRAIKVLPARGKIAIFNRSYYETVLVEKVHKDYLELNLPDRCKTEDTIEKRYNHIKNFENYLWENGTTIIKFFLHVSENTQRKRFLERIEKKDKNWKFSASDLLERSHWDEYQQAFETAINKTSTSVCPWYIIPADKKWYSRAVISEVLLGIMKTMNPQYPTVPDDHEAALAECRKLLSK